MDATLYGIPGSHPVRAVALMLEHKGISYERVDLRPGAQWGLPARGFPGKTVPALLIDGERIQESRTIARALERLRPEPPLFPADRSHRALVAEAERFADEVLQPLARRLVLAAGARDISSLVECAQEGPLGPLLAHDVPTRAMIMEAAREFFGVTDDRERVDLDALPAVLDRIDEWVERGVLGGPEPNAADFQTAPSLCLLTYRADLRSAVRARPSAELERFSPA